jgi:hypothetical protein
MKVLIIGGGGLVGQKLARALATRETLRGAPISSLVLADVIDPAQIDAPFEVQTVTCDIADPASVASVIDADTDVIYLLAAIVSGQAEEDMTLGYQINMMGTMNVLERCRELASKPVVVFTSSIAVYGGEVADPIIDDSFLNPQTSYGAQKAIGELLINDYSRKGIVDAHDLGPSGQAEPRRQRVYVVDLPRTAERTRGRLPRRPRLPALLPQPPQMHREPAQRRGNPCAGLGQKPLHDDAGPHVDHWPNDRGHAQRLRPRAGKADPLGRTARNPCYRQRLALRSAPRKGAETGPHRRRQL